MTVVLGIFLIVCGYMIGYARGVKIALDESRENILESKDKINNLERRLSDMTNHMKRMSDIRNGDTDGERT